jgi:hypothetical protein
VSDYDMSIHHNRDAAAWAKFFMETWRKNGGGAEWITEGLMLGWFANAMMAMYDTSRDPRPRSAPSPEPREERCPACGGCGRVSSVWGDDKRRCPDCGGTGKGRE